MKGITLRIASCLIGLVLVAGSGPYSSRAQPMGSSIDERLIPLAEVDGTAISVGLFKKTYVEFLIATGQNDTRANRYRHLEALLDTYLLGAYARERGYAGNDRFDRYMERQRKKALGGMYYERFVLDRVPAVTDEENRLAFASSQDKVHVRHLFFKREQEAREAYRRLQQGEDFVDLANEVYGTAAYDSSAGDLGLITYFSVDDAFAEAAFSLQKQYDYTEPVRSRVGFHIIRLENRYSNPLLTESAYAARKTGVGENVQLRKTRLQGDAFVRSFMEELNYEVNAPALRGLERSLEAIEHSVEPRPITLQDAETLDASDIEDLAVQVTPETVLVRYEWAGESRHFTAGAYYNWLEELPFAEARSNPAASVGRALRNEVLGLAGEAAGLGDAPIVREAVRHEALVYLSRQLKDVLRADTTRAPSDDMLARAYERLTQGRPGAIQEADEVREQLRRQLTPLAAEYYTLRELYAQARIHVDTVRVNTLVRH